MRRAPPDEIDVVLAQLDQARSTIEALRSRIEVMEAALLGTDPMPLVLRLTPHESLLLAFLLQREQASKDQILSALYSLRPDGDEPEMKIIDVYVCKIRKKLKPFGLEIVTLRGLGYAVPKVAKDRIRALMDEERGVAA